MTSTCFTPRLHPRRAPVVSRFRSISSPLLYYLLHPFLVDRNINKDQHHHSAQLHRRVMASSARGTCFDRLLQPGRGRAENGKTRRRARQISMQRQ